MLRMLLLRPLALKLRAESRADEKHKSELTRIASCNFLRELPRVESARGGTGGAGAWLGGVLEGSN